MCYFSVPFIFLSSVYIKDARTQRGQRTRCPEIQTQLNRQSSYPGLSSCGVDVVLLCVTYERNKMPACVAF